MPTAAQARFGKTPIGPAARIERANIEPAPAVERTVSQTFPVQPDHACEFCRRCGFVCRHVAGAHVERRQPAYGEAVRSHNLIRPGD